MISLIQTFSSLIGLLSIIASAIMTVLVARFSTKSNIIKAASEAQGTTITALQATILALQADISVLRGKVEDITKDKMKLEKTIETICMALKIKKGLVISVQGEFVSIEEKNGATTTTRIHEKE